MTDETEAVKKAAYDQIHGQPPLRKYSVAEVKSIVYPLMLELDRLHEELSEMRRKLLIDMTKATQGMGDPTPPNQYRHGPLGRAMRGKKHD